jgi:hypothetical protein
VVRDVGIAEVCSLCMCREQQQPQGNMVGQDQRVDGCTSRAEACQQAGAAAYGTDRGIMPV